MPHLNGPIAAVNGVECQARSYFFWRLARPGRHVEHQEVLGTKWTKKWEDLYKPASAGENRIFLMCQGRT